MEKSTLKKIGFLCLILTLVSYPIIVYRYLQSQQFLSQESISDTPA